MSARLGPRVEKRGGTTAPVRGHVAVCCPALKPNWYASESDAWGLLIARCREEHGVELRPAEGEQLPLPEGEQAVLW